MKYYVLHITITDGVETKSVFDFDTRDKAEIEFHKNIAYDMEIGTIEKSLVMVINETGAVEMCREWTKTE